MLPMQISSDGTIGNRIGTVNIVSIPHDHYLRSEESSVCDRLGTGLSIRRQPSPIPPSRRNSALCYPSVIPSGTLENNFSLYHQLNLPKHLFTNQVLHRHRSWQTAPGINTVIMRRLDEEEIRKRENENDVLIERQRVNHRRDESRVNERSAKRKRDKLP
jgi:hypothetical protein